MSFQLLKKEVIDVGLCQGCGLCAGSCKHLELKDLRPVLKDYCIMEKEGQKCGRCYERCPQVRQIKLQKKIPLEIRSFQTTDPAIKKTAASGGFVTTLNKYILEKQVVSHLIEIKNVEDRPQPVVSTDPNEVMQYSGVAYGRSGVLQKLIQLLGQEHKRIGIVGVPCEMRGTSAIEQDMKKDVFKIGLFCNANIRTHNTDEGLVGSPCSNGCPAGVNAAGYVNFIRNGKYQEAVNLIREQNPLPSICGRICTHECEYGCTLIGTNKPIAIRELKKFVTEWEMKNPKTPNKLSQKNGNKVAIIGSGPAGLTAAYYLANLGYLPTIFEKSDQIGGMLRFGVPKFRLPDEVLDYDIEFVKEAGVEIKTNSPLGPNLTFEDLRKQGFKAIFLATGQYKPRTLKIEGEDSPNVYSAINFLVDRKYRYWEKQEEYKDKTVAIIGGGPVAVDVAQTALRLGARKVYLTEIRSEPELKMVIGEIPENEFKFMEYKYDTSTTKIVKNTNGTVSLLCHKVKPKRGDDGRLQFLKVDGSEYSIEADAIVIAIGQEVDHALLNAAGGDKLQLKRDKIVVNELTFETNLPGVFAGGDIVERGKNVAIAAIAHGREAARSIDRYLKGQNLKDGRIFHTNMYFNGPIKDPKDKSIKPKSLEDATENLWLNFKEIDGVFTEQLAVEEAKRCLNCNNFCSHCQDFAGIYADITAGEIGSEKGFTTVVIWSPEAKKIVNQMIEKGLLIEGKVSQEAIDRAIDRKMKRNLIEFAQTPREKIYNAIKLNGTSTISKLSQSLNIPAKDVRYHALRLTQEKKLEMNLEESAVEPSFSIYVETPSE